MTPFDGIQPHQEQEAYINGSADASMGESPQSTDDLYLKGYLEGIRAGILEGRYTLQIRWLSPAYVRRAYDGGDR